MILILTPDDDDYRSDYFINFFTERSTTTLKKQVHSLKVQINLSLHTVNRYSQLGSFV